MKLNADQSVSMGLRPLSTRALRALELRDLNPVDTDWSAFKYYLLGRPRRPNIVIRNRLLYGFMFVYVYIYIYIYIIYIYIYNYIEKNKNFLEK